MLGSERQHNNGYSPSSATDLILEEVKSNTFKSVCCQVLREAITEDDDDDSGCHIRSPTETL